MGRLLTEPRQSELVSSNGKKRSLIEETGVVYVYKTVKFVCKDGLPAREGVEVGAVDRYGGWSTFR